MRHTFLAAMLAIVGIFVTAAPAEADVCSTCYGAWVSNVGSSNGKVVLSNNGRTMDLWPGDLSRYYSNFRDVDSVWIPGGCDAYSQWGTRYPGDRWYSLPDTAGIKFTVYC